MVTPADVMVLGGVFALVLGGIGWACERLGGGR